MPVREMSFRVSLTSSFVLLIVAFAGADAANPPKPFSRAPYLQFASPTMMHVVWRTEGPITPVVRYGKDLRKLDKEISGGAIVARASLIALERPANSCEVGRRSAHRRI
jgi:hypothetical protein